MIRNLLAALAIAFTVSAVRVKDRSLGPHDSIDVMSLRLQGLDLFAVDPRLTDDKVQLRKEAFEMKALTANMPENILRRWYTREPLSMVQELIDENDDYLWAKDLTEKRWKIA